MCVCVTFGAIWKLIMAITIGAVLVIGLIYIQQSSCLEMPCPDGRLCPTNWTCCEQGCCVPTTAHSRSADIFKDHGFMDHPWPVLFFLGILGGILICCMWFCICKRYTSSPDGMLAISCACCMNPLRTSDEIDSAGSLYPPPHYSRCGSFHQAPPPYSEVQSKPDLYPLVITCAEGEGKVGGNYVMVQYFRNYVIRPPPGSLSATSTAESLNSSFICNATNEANSIIPPPYSCATNFDEFGVGRTMLRSMSSVMDASVTPLPRPAVAISTTPIRQRNTTNLRENMLNSPVQHNIDSSLDGSLEVLDNVSVYYGHRGCRSKSGTSNIVHQSSPTSVDNALYEHEAYGLRQIFHHPSGCDSPPQPSSPSRESVRRQTDERRQRRLAETLRRNIRKSSLYMPLSTAHPARTSRISPGTRASSRSAPATPCSNLVPNLLNFTQRVSASRHSSRSSRLEEEYDPLLTTDVETRTDHKF